MTQETRETLTKMLERGGVDCGRPCAEFYPEEIAALRDVLTPRTCAGCKSRHEITGACYKDVQDPEGEEVTNTRSPWNWRNRDTFGCSEWKPRQAREGETS